MELSKYFTDNAVLQCDMPFFVKGRAMPLSSVTAELVSDGYSVRTAALSDKDGFFNVPMQKMRPGFDTYCLTVSAGDETVRVENLVFGDVFLCGGQSNMEYPVAATDTKDEYMREQERYIRCFCPRQDIVSSVNAQTMFTQGSWLSAKTPQDFAQVTAVGYMFAKKYYKEHNIPVGIINTAVGGAHIRSFLSEEMESGSREFTKCLKLTVKGWEQKAAEEYLDSRKFERIYNMRIAPLSGIHLKGVLWYQGESSVKSFDTAKLFYQGLLALVKGYRKLFGQERLPFVFCHIANHLYYDSPFSICYINEAMDRACQKLADCQSVPIYDVLVKWQLDCDDKYFHPIHPTNKEYIALRMYEVFCGKKLFPAPLGYSVSGNALVVKYDMPVASRDGLSVKGFAICGADGYYHHANAQLHGDTVKLESAYVTSPAGYSYAFFSGNEMCNLVSSGGMPAYMSRSKYQKADPDKYFVYTPFINCDVPITGVNNFRPDCGYAGYYPTYTEGSMLASGVATIGYDDKIKEGGDCSLRVDYDSGRRNFFRFSVRPLAFYSNSINYFALNDEMVLHLSNPSDDTLEFIGVLVSCNNRRYIFAANDECLPQKIPAAPGFAAVRVNLVKWQSEDYIISSANSKSAITEAEFAFIAHGSGSLYLNNVEFIRK